MFQNYDFPSFSIIFIIYLIHTGYPVPSDPFLDSLQQRWVKDQFSY